MGNYLLLVLVFVLGLASKPTLVVLPFVLLLLDFWPLRAWPQGRTELAERDLPRRFVLPWRLILEKVPLFALAVASSIVAFLAQQHGGATKLSAEIPVSARIGNAIVAYISYLGKMFYPARLSVLYPHPGNLPLRQVIFCLVLLMAITAAAIYLSRRHRFFIVGWLWYLIALIPVIGLVQVGAQAMADRYTYVPSIGIAVIAIWTCDWLVSKWRLSKAVVTALGISVLAALLVCTRIQTGYWRDSVSLFARAVEVTDDNYTAHANLGVAFREHGLSEQATEQFQTALEIKPDYALAHYNMGYSLAKQGHVDEAIGCFRKAVKYEPDKATMHGNLANLLAAKGQLAEAVQHFRLALEIEPDHISSLNGLAWVLCKDPNSAVYDPNEAVVLAERAAELTGYHDASVLGSLGAAYEAKGQTAKAVQISERALALASANQDRILYEQILSQISRYRTPASAQSPPQDPR